MKQSPLHNGVAEINGEVKLGILQEIERVAVEGLGVGVGARPVPDVYVKQIVPWRLAASVHQLEFKPKNK